MSSYSGYSSNKDKIDFLINQVLPKEAPQAKNNIVHASKSIEKKTVSQYIHIAVWGMVTWLVR